MKQFLSALGARLSTSLERSARERARIELLRLDRRLLDDAGISVALLHEGVGSWPWRLDGEVTALEDARRSKNLVKEQKQAMRELYAMSDAELADLAITRGDIKRVVREGRRDLDMPEHTHPQAA